MANRLEKEEAAPETRKRFEDSLISHVIFEAVPEILRNCENKKEIDDRDIGQVIGWMIDDYKNSNLTGRILGFKDYRDRDAFFDHVSNIVTRKARELKGTYGEVPIVAEKNEVTGRELYRGERNMLKLLMGEVFTALHKKHLTTKDYDFEEVSEGIIKKILDDYEVEKVTNEAGREQFRKEITAVVHKSFTPEALKEYEQKKKTKGKKYSPEEKDMLLNVIEETVERVSIIMEDENLDADANLKTPENIIPSDFSKRDIEKVREIIKSVLTGVIQKIKVSPANRENYSNDLVPLIISALKERPPNPTETILKNLYKK